MNEQTDQYDLPRPKIPAAWKLVGIIVATLVTALFFWAVCQDNGCEDPQEVAYKDALEIIRAESPGTVVHTANGKLIIINEPDPPGRLPTAYVSCEIQALTPENLMGIRGIYEEGAPDEVDMLRHFIKGDTWE